MTFDVQALGAALAREGLLLRGGFEPTPYDGVPDAAPGRPVRWLALVGVAGSHFWPHFQAAPEAHDGLPDPLDRWSRRLGQVFAVTWGAVAPMHPFEGPPFLPFARWAARAEGLPASPLGLLLHPRYGLWHSYRFALAWADPPGALHVLTTPAPDLCAACSGQPCLSACPVRAFDGRGYAVDRCVEALQQPDPPPCRHGLCLARAACPVGAQWAHEAPHARFLMDAFVAARRAGRGEGGG